MKQGHVLILIKGIYEKSLHLAWNLMIKIESLLFKIGGKKRCQVTSLLFNIILELLVSATRHGKLIKHWRASRLEKTSKAFFILR